MPYLYLVQERMFVVSKESIYTMGYCDTKPEYIRGDALFIQTTCSDDVIADVIQLFKIKYMEVNTPDDHRHSFQGDSFEMIYDIDTIYQKHVQVRKWKFEDCHDAIIQCQDFYFDTYS